MKNSGFYTIIIIAIFTFQSAMSQFSKVPQNEINKKDLKLTRELTEKLMEGLKTGNYYTLTEQEATPEMVKGLTAKTQEAVNNQITGMFGEYEGMKFVEALKPDNDGNYIVYRFKGTYSDSEDGAEIRAVLNNDQKLAGFWIVPWKDEIENRP